MLKTALVVDDSRVARLALSRALERQGLRVEQAASAVEAIDRLRAVRPDVVFMDVTMPEIDGLAATELIRREGGDIPVVLCSAEEGERVRAQLAEQRVSAFLSKPPSDEGIGRVLAMLAAGRVNGAESAADAGAHAERAALREEFEGLRAEVSAVLEARLAQERQALLEAFEARIAEVLGASRQASPRHADAEQAIARTLAAAREEFDRRFDAALSAAQRSAQAECDALRRELPSRLEETCREARAAFTRADAAARNTQRILLVLGAGLVIALGAALLA